MKHLPSDISPLVWSFAALGAAGLLFLIVWYHASRKSHPEQEEKEEATKESETSSDAVQTSLSMPLNECSSLSTGESWALAASLQEENLRELVQDRLADLDEEREDVERWSLGIVDLLDELRLMQPSYSPQDAETTSRIMSELNRLLREQDCEPIDLDEWTPSRQRATRIEYNLLENNTPRIISKGASGLVVKNRLVRKQEVTLNLPPNH